MGNFIKVYCEVCVTILSLRVTAKVLEADFSYLAHGLVWSQRVRAKATVHWSFNILAFGYYHLIYHRRVNNSIRTILIIILPTNMKTVAVHHHSAVGREVLYEVYKKESARFLDSNWSDFTSSARHCVGSEKIYTGHADWHMCTPARI